MLRFGIFTLEQYLAAQRQGRKLGPQVSYQLLDVADASDPAQVKAFEDISFRLRTSNGTFRTTFRNRFETLNQAVLPWLKKLFSPSQPLYLEDRAVSHGLTSWEWAEQVFQEFPLAEMDATDLLVELIELRLADGSAFIFDNPSGPPLQYIRPPFALPIRHLESWRYPVNRMLGQQGLRRFEALRLPADWTTQPPAGSQVHKIPYIHPEARKLQAETNRFHYRQGSVFDPSPHSSQVIRTMNILIHAYFSEQQLAEAARVMFQSLAPGGLWITGRTWEEDLSHHATLFLRQNDGWEVLERIGSGAETESLILQTKLE